MKVLFLNPPFMPRFTRNSRSPAVSKGGCVYYPIWMGYAAAYAKDHGHEIRLIDSAATSITTEETIKLVEKFNPDIAVIDTSTPSIYSDVKVLEKVKEATGCFTILVGSHVTATPEETLKISEKIDSVARKEYDATVLETVEFVKAGRTDFEKIKGLSYRDVDTGELKHNEDRDPMPAEELEKMSFVSKIYADQLKIEDYFYPSVLYPEITIVTGRGCPFRCTFCFIPQVMNGHDYRARSAKSVVDEFEWITKNLPQVQDIMIEDDTFTADRGRIVEIADEIKKRGLKVTFTCNARADVPLDVLKKLKEAGCREVCVGFESGNQQVLNSVRKGTTIPKIRQFMKDVKEADILVHGCFMLGNYGDSKETIRETIDFAKELEPDTAQFFPIMVYPGTEAFRQFNDAGYLTTTNWDEWLDKDGQHNTLVSRPGLSNKELVELCDVARKEFYLRPSFIAKKIWQAMTNPTEFPRLFRSGIVFSRFLWRTITAKNTIDSNQSTDTIMPANA